MGHKFEIFSGGCELCKNAIEILKNTAAKHEVVEYDLNSPIKKEIQEKIKKYDIDAVPTIIVDGEHKIVGIPKSTDIEKMIADF
ncbi:MAG: thioredoxin family protein [Promethearchaeota archaeon]|jgi:glutaredoxin